MEGIGSSSAKVTFNLLLATSMAVIGSTFQFGYNTGVINAPQTVIEEFYNQTFILRFGHSISQSTIDLLWGFTVAIFAVGGMIGSLCAGAAAERFGLKRSMLYNNSIALLAALLMGFSQLANSFEMLIIGRFAIGLNSGINMGIAPMYLTECAPVRLRGMFGTLGQLGIVTSILLSQILGLHWILGTSQLWGLLFSLTGIFAIYQLLVIPLCPESPRYLLIVQKKEKAAIATLKWLRGDDYDSSKELEDIRLEFQSNSTEQKTKILELFKHSHLRQPLLIAVVMQLSQQLSGINAVFYYSTEIFLNAGIPKEYTGLTTVGMGVVNVVMTMVSVSLIERAGRKILHLIGLGGMCVCAVVLVVLLNLDQSETVAWLTLAPILIFVAFFQTGPGAIPWFITTELFDQRSRPSAVSVAGLANWMGNFVIALAYPSLDGAIGGYTFIIFAVLLAIFWLFTYFKVPETKGRNIMEITALFQPKNTRGVLTKNLDVADDVIFENGTKF